MPICPELFPQLYTFVYIFGTCDICRSCSPSGDRLGGTSTPGESLLEILGKGGSRIVEGGVQGHRKQFGSGTGTGEGSA